MGSTTPSAIYPSLSAKQNSLPNLTEETTSRLSHQTQLQSLRKTSAKRWTEATQSPSLQTA